MKDIKSCDYKCNYCVNFNSLIRFLFEEDGEIEPCKTCFETATEDNETPCFERSVINE